MKQDEVPGRLVVNPVVQSVSKAKHTVPDRPIGNNNSEAKALERGQRDNAL